MKNYINLLITIICFIPFNTAAQTWNRCKGKFAKSQVHRFMAFDSSLIAACHEGILFYDSKSNKWDEKITVGSVTDFIEYNNDLYILCGPPQIKVMSNDRTISKIPIDLTRFDIQTLHSILVFKDRLYVAGGKGVFYKSLTDSIWHKMETKNSIASLQKTMKVISYQDKVIAISKNGIFISDNGTIFNKWIKSDEILKSDPDITFPLQRNMLNYYRINGILNNNNKGIYAYSHRQIFYSNDLINWEKYDNETFRELFHVFPLCCNGLIVTGFDFKYTFQKDNWNQIKTVYADLLSTSNFFIYNNKIFTGIVSTENEGIWSADFNYSLQFE